MERVARLYGVLAGIGIFFGVVAACVGGEEALLAPVAAPVTAPLELSPERREAESRTTELMARIASLEMEVQAANKSRESLQAEAEIKINDLLDAVEADKMRQVEAEAQLKAAREEAQLQVSLLEQTLEQLRGQFDAVTAQLAVRDLEMAKEIDRVDRDSLALALDEIERLELEQAAGDAAAVQQQGLLIQQIETLRQQVAESGEALASTGRELEKERRSRFELEARSQEQVKAIEETGAMLAEAKAALARQYDAIREQVQAGSTMRLEDGVTGGEADGKAKTLVTLSPDLVPLIGQLEAATATAMDDVKALREQLERERDLFATAAVEKDAELAAAHAAALSAMTEAHDLRIAGLKGELEGLRKAVEARDRAIGMLEDDLKAERDSTTRVLDVARETEATLTARIRELETAFALPDTESAASDARDGASLRDTVFGSILDMIPGDKAAAIDRFEALPPASDIPDPVLKAMGNLYRDAGNYAAARALFEKLAERNPGDLYAERKLVMTLFDMGLYDQALDRLTGPGAATPPEEK